MKYFKAVIAFFKVATCTVISIILIAHNIENVYENLNKVTSNHQLLKNSNLNSPAISLCTSLYNAFTKCVWAKYFVYCNQNSTNECNESLFLQHNNTNEIFVNLRFCPLFKKLFVIQQTLHKNGSFFRWHPVMRYLQFGRICVYFVGK